MSVSEQSTEQAAEVDITHNDTVIDAEGTVPVDVSKAVKIDPRGDLTIVATKEHSTGCFIVCSRAMARASAYFDCMLYGPFKEGQKQQETDKAWAVELSDDDPEAFHVIALVLHGKLDELPKQVDHECFFNLVFLADKYDIMAKLKPFWKDWHRWRNSHRLISNPDHIDDAPERLTQDLGIAYMLGDGRAFRDALKAIVWRVNATEHGRLYLPKSTTGVELDVCSTKMWLDEVKGYDFLYRAQGAPFDIQDVFELLRLVEEDEIRAIEDEPRASDGIMPTETLTKYFLEDDPVIQQLGALEHIQQARDGMLRNIYSMVRHGYNYLSRCPPEKPACLHYDFDCDIQVLGRLKKALVNYQGGLWYRGFDENVATTEVSLLRVHRYLQEMWDFVTPAPRDRHRCCAPWDQNKIFMFRDVPHLDALLNEHKKHMSNQAEKTGFDPNFFAGHWGYRDQQRVLPSEASIQNSHACVRFLHDPRERPQSRMSFEPIIQEMNVQLPQGDADNGMENWAENGTESWEENWEDNGADSWQGDGSAVESW